MKSFLLFLLFTFCFCYSDLEALQRVVYCEARGQSEDGKLAVAYTVVNRSSKSGRSIEYEATKPSQFCVWGRAMTETAAALKCKTAAYTAIERDKPDPSNGATFFYSRNNVPNWARGINPCAVIGDHKIFKDIPPY